MYCGLNREWTSVNYRLLEHTLSYMEQETVYELQLFSLLIGRNITVQMTTSPAGDDEDQPSFMNVLTRKS